jgi:hypothetical protein
MISKCSANEADPCRSEKRISPYYINVEFDKSIKAWQNPVIIGGMVD